MTLIFDDAELFHMNVLRVEERYYYYVQSKDKTHKPIVYGKDKYIHSQSFF